VGEQGSTLGGIGDAVERDEHVAAVLRLRRVCCAAVILWPLFGLLDWFIVEHVHPGRLWFFLLLRAIGLVALGVGVLFMFGPRLPGPRVVAWVEPLVTTTLVVLVTLGGVEFGGIDSPVVTGVVLIILCRAAVLAQHWQRALPTVLAIAIAFPVTMLVAALLSPTMAAELASPADRGGFLVSVAFVLASAAITLYGGHIVWELRRQVFQARSLGRYRLKRRIGKGGMGEVWQAHHHALRRDVAVKIIRADDRADPLALTRFEREVRATAELSHPNTVRVFDYGVTEDGLCYYAMELLRGEDLAARVAGRGPLSPAEVVRLGWQAARALGEAHGRGIVHRDVKPENLFIATIGGEEMIKVLDFGLARVVGGEVSPAVTQTGWAVGTPRWTSPEVAAGRVADPRSDVYALGAVMYFLVTGTPPFQDRDIGALLAAHLEQPIEPPSRRLGRPVPAALEAIIVRCLEKDPARRFADASALAVALEQATASAPAVLSVRALSPAPAVEHDDDDEADDAPTADSSPGAALPARAAVGSQGWASGEPSLELPPTTPREALPPRPDDSIESLTAIRRGPRFA
jgi:eukaryotic-like serine/threonine-protein kinase